MPRIHCPPPLRAGARLALPAGAARHVQVLRMQPGAALTLFDGQGGQWRATITRMGRSEVEVEVGEPQAIEREAVRAVHLALGMPANDRMDWLVEKATELGAAGIAPLLVERSVLRLSGERASRKQAHWQAIAVAACEQCGRNRLPDIAAPRELRAWLQALPAGGRRLLLSLEPEAPPLTAVADAEPVVLLSGPEGGLSPAEVALAREAGFQPISLGPRVLRAETAPLAALARLTA
jgi:16S rRNA (uracil1498-N3)-methyltransferase